MKILLADDDAVNCWFLSARLAEWGYEVEVSRDGREAWERLQEPDAPRFAILDWIMPGMDGIEICREIRRTRPDPYTYMLLLSSRTELEHRVEGMNAGADDYIMKPFSPEDLQARIRAGKRILELEQRLLHQASYDTLTGLLNRRAVLRVLETEIERAGRSGIPLGIAMADLDYFKQINDRLGHLVGDEVLRDAAQRMKAMLRPYDSIGRYGGEEFLLVLPGCDPATAEKLAERLRESIRSHPFDIAGKVTVSMGIAASLDPTRVDARELLMTADNALLSAKKERDCVRIGSIAHVMPMS